MSVAFLVALRGSFVTCLEEEEVEEEEEEEAKAAGDEMDVGRAIAAAPETEYGEDEDDKPFPALPGVCGWEGGRVLLPLKALVPPGVRVWVCTMVRRLSVLLAVGLVKALLPLEVRRGVWSRS